MAKDITVRAGVGRWLRHLQATRPQSHRSYRSSVRPFVAEHGRRPVGTVRPHHVTTCIDSQHHWRPSTKLATWSRLRTCFAWLLSEGHAVADPLGRARRPSHYRTASRGAEFVLPPDLSLLLLSVSRGPWLAFLRALERTGARPAELANAVAENYRRDEKLILHRGDETRLYVHKTARRRCHGAPDRTIYLDDDTAQVVEKQARAGGLLFPAADGSRWSPSRIAGQWGRTIRAPRVVRWLDLHQHSARRVVPYSYRHTWITRAVLRGISPALIADLTGTSLAMIERHYSHAAADRRAMRRVFLAAL